MPGSFPGVGHGDGMAPESILIVFGHRDSPGLIGGAESSYASSSGIHQRAPRRF